MSCLLGIDLGTSSVKALLMDEGGTVRSVRACDYPILSPSEGFSEQEPRLWWEGTSRAVRACLAEAEVQPDSVRAVGLSGQMHGMVLLDAAGAVLRPAVIWCDRRSSEQIREINERIGQEELGRITLNPLFPGFQVASLLWVLENEPQVHRRIAHVLLPKDYIRYRLTGEVVSDYSDASSTLTFDMAARCWSSRIIDGLGMQRAWFPRCEESTRVVGAVSRRAAVETGLAEGTPVIAGGADQPMQAIGNGITEQGVVSCTIGTGGQVFALCDRPIRNPLRNTHVFCNVIPGAWYAMAATLSAGLSLSWFREKIAQEPDYERITAEAQSVSPGSDGLLFLPYLAGERTPHLNPSARAVFFGLTLAHTRAHMTRAVMEGVVFSLRDGYEVLLDLGIRADRIVASGGGSRGRLWLQILADILGREIHTTRSVEQAAFGAAIAAAVGVGLYPDLPRACGALVREGDAVVQPDPSASRLYTEMYGRYRSIYERTRTLVGADGDGVSASAKRAFAPR